MHMLQEEEVLSIGPDGAQVDPARILEVLKP